MKLTKIGFGGGCHWCTEAVFQSLRGVESVEQGWIASNGEQEAFSEAVVVHFDEKIIPLRILIEIHLHTHSSTSNHSMREKYRSAVYAFEVDQIHESNQIIKELQNGFDKKLITQVYPFVAFKMSPEMFRNYFKNNPSKPFCISHINPKLELLKVKFSSYELYC